MDFVELIGNYAFPIVMCAALFWKINDQDKQHKEEMKQVTDALNNNTLAVTRLVEHFEEKRFD